VRAEKETKAADVDYVAIILFRSDAAKHEQQELWGFSQKLTNTKFAIGTNFNGD
jgi:hypothetical protein